MKFNMCSNDTQYNYIHFGVVHVHELYYILILVGDNTSDDDGRWQHQYTCVIRYNTISINIYQYQPHLM